MKKCNDSMALKERYTFFDSKVKQRAKESLNEYAKESLCRLSALFVRDYRSDARKGIKALQILGRSNRWNEDLTKTTLKQTYEEMEGETLENFEDRGLQILAALVKNQNTNRASSELSASSHLLLRGESKSTFSRAAIDCKTLALSH